MKTVSIRQPWASFIAQGIKDIENRTWRTNYRGPIYIHACGPTKFNIELTDPQMKAVLPIIKDIFVGGVSGKINSAIPFGAIIGKVDIVDCVINHPSIWAEKTAVDICPDTGVSIIRKGQKTIWNWVLENAELFDKPILNVKGKLSLWDFQLNT